MSILIKGMEMPKNCGECQLCYDYLECMAASHIIKINFYTRPKDCPLVDVEAKGRLLLNEQPQSKRKEREKMYNSPIKIFEHAQTISELIEKDADEYIYKAVLSLNIDVDKDELIKALRYDREQYDKGYHDAMLNFGWHEKEATR